MKCPSCGHLNIDGEDLCQACRQPLTTVPSPGVHKTFVEHRIETRPLLVVKPVPPLTVAPSETVRNVIALLAEKNIGCVLVVSGGEVVGIFSERDALTRIGTRMEECADQPIRLFMTPQPEQLTMQDTIAFALNRMALGDYRHIPIQDNGRPVGIVSVRDMIRFITEQFPEIQTTPA